MTAIALLCTTGDVGGMERVVASLDVGLRARGHHVISCYPMATESDPRLEAWLEDQGASCRRDPAVLRVTEPHRWSGIVALRRLARDLNPEIINIHYGSSFISFKDVLALRLSGLHRRILVTVHHPSGAENSRRKRWLTKVASLLAHSVIAVSKATQSSLISSGVPVRRTKVIYSGLQQRAARDPTAARAKLGVSQQTFVVGCVARLVEHKGVDQLITAVSLGLQIEDWMLLIAGEGSQRKHLEDSARRIDPRRIRFSGYVEDIDEFLASCDVFALPSAMEGFGLVFLEAAFQGVPSIGAAVGGVPEAIVDGETGLLVPPNDPAAINEALNRLTDARRRRLMASAALERATRSFGLEMMVDRYETALVGRRGRATHGCPV